MQQNRYETITGLSVSAPNNLIRQLELIPDHVRKPEGGIFNAFTITL
jgi:hypothetical protein